jgi:glycosyltransferase involved in cell wall biosynthesis
MIMNEINLPSVVFSVVIPTYNRSEKLLRALESLNNQTFLNFEVLVCDDGSTDNTKTLITTFTEIIKFKALRYFYAPNWGGPARPRNTGIAAAKGNWICLLDSDDLWHPEKLEKMLPYLNDFDLLYHQFILITSTGKSRTLSSRQLKKPVFQDLMLNGHNGCIINSGVSVRKTLLQKAGGFSEESILVSVEDADLWLRIARLTDRFKYVPESLGVYYLDGGNITAYNAGMLEKLQFLFNKHAPHLNNTKLIQKASFTNNYHLGRIRQQMGNSKEALRLYRSSIKSPNKTIALRSAYWIIKQLFM